MSIGIPARAKARGPCPSAWRLGFLSVDGVVVDRNLQLMCGRRKMESKNLSVSVVKLKQSVIISKRNLNIVRPKLSWHTGTAYLYIMGWCPNACPGPDVGCVFFVVWHLHRRSKAYTVSSVACTGS